MKRLLKTKHTQSDLLTTCIEGISKESLRTRFEACRDEILDQSLQYEQKAIQAELFTIAPVKAAKKSDPIVIGDLKKSELVTLYEYYFCNQGKLAGKVYSELRLSVKKCPFCGDIGIPENLDHYLPKTHFPQFSVCLQNLIPSCLDCNMGSKGAAYAENAEDQILHPYLDKDHFFNERWVYAKVIIGDPCIMEFYVQPPQHWTELDKKRVNKHFEDFNLAHRYSIQSDDQLSILIYQRKTIMLEHSEDQFKEHLASVADAPNLFPNHWQKVMHQALATNADFCKAKF